MVDGVAIIADVDFDGFAFRERLLQLCQSGLWSAPVRFKTCVRGEDRVGVFVPFFVFFLTSFCGVNCGVVSSSSVFCEGGAVPLDDAPSFTFAGVAGE